MKNKTIPLCISDYLIFHYEVTFLYLQCMYKPCKVLLLVSLMFSNVVFQIDEIIEKNEVCYESKPLVNDRESDETLTQEGSEETASATESELESHFVRGPEIQVSRL